MTLVTTPAASNADSYASVAEADTYFTARGIATWTGATADKEAALRRATTYLDNQYRERWKGIRTNETQSLAWPRLDGVRGYPYRYGFATLLLDLDGFQIGSNVVPQQVKTATIEAALLALTGVSLEPTLERGGRIKSIGKSVGPLRKDIVYMDGASSVDRYLVIEGLLTGLVKSMPGAGVANMSLVRG
jgi:hypothetical protein